MQQQQPLQPRPPSPRLLQPRRRSMRWAADPPARPSRSAAGKPGSAAPAALCALIVASCTCAALLTRRGGGGSQGPGPQGFCALYHASQTRRHPQSSATPASGCFRQSYLNPNPGSLCILHSLLCRLPSAPGPWLSIVACSSLSSLRWSGDQHWSRLMRDGVMEGLPVSGGAACLSAGPLWRPATARAGAQGACCAQQARRGVACGDPHLIRPPWR
jgi:hypothetical protein